MCSYKSEIASTRFGMTFTRRSEIKSNMAARRYKQKNPVRFYAFLVTFHALLLVPHGEEKMHGYCSEVMKLRENNG